MHTIDGADSCGWNWVELEWVAMNWESVWDGTAAGIGWGLVEQGWNWSGWGRNVIGCYSSWMWHWVELEWVGCFPFLLRGNSQAGTLGRHCRSNKQRQRDYIYIQRETERGREGGRAIQIYIYIYCDQHEVIAQHNIMYQKYVYVATVAILCVCMC